MTTALLEARDLAKAFGNNKAVDGVTLCVPRGTIVGLLGLNGAGKSTLMRLLSGVLRPDRGVALVSGEDVYRNPLNARRKLGYLPEAASGFSNLTVREFLTFAAEGRGVARIAVPTAIAAVTDLIELRPALDRVLSTLSKGWRQRAWLAQALVHDPATLVLDEPTDGLDPTQKTELREILKSLSSTKAILMSTHILEEAEALCDRIVVMAVGRVVQDAEIGALLAADGRIAQSFSRLTAKV
jgi:ABC-2 type transport system ATP-binding protein